MFRFFETRIDATAPPPPGEPPGTLLAFYWHYVRQAKGIVAFLFALGFALAVVEALVPFLIGRLVTVLSSAPPDRVLDEAAPILGFMAAIILLMRPLGTVLFRLVVNHFMA